MEVLLVLLLQAVEQVRSLESDILLAYSYITEWMVQRKGINSLSSVRTRMKWCRIVQMQKEST